DTARNILAKKEAVIHIADEENIQNINETAANLEPTESELSRTTFTMTQGAMVSVPLINELSIKMEVSLYKHVPIKTENTVTADLLLLKVETYHVKEELYHQGRIDPDKLNPMSRLAGNDYAALGKRVTLKRPD
ncbi:MAG: flavin reductase family protein, partial [Vagococcus sp.]